MTRQIIVNIISSFLVDRIKKLNGTPGLLFHICSGCSLCFCLPLEWVQMRIIKLWLSPTKLDMLFSGCGAAGLNEAPEEGVGPETSHHSGSGCEHSAQILHGGAGEPSPEEHNPVPDGGCALSTLQRSGGWADMLVWRRSWPLCCRCRRIFLVWKGTWMTWSHRSRRSSRAWRPRRRPWRRSETRSPRLCLVTVFLFKTLVSKLGLSV